MNLRCWTLLVLLPLLFCQACGGPGPQEPVLLVDYDFDHCVETVLGRSVGQHPNLHLLTPGWARPKDGGIWILGEEAEAQLYLLGREAQLTLVCNTLPRLAAKEQAVTVLFNGQELGRFPLETNWLQRQIDLELPDDLLVTGLNTLTIRAATYLTEKQRADERDKRPLSLYLHRLAVTASLDNAELQQWRELTEVTVPDSDWDSVLLPPVESLTVVGSVTDSTTAFGRPARPWNPDVLMILLDAARPDHFGCYGYHRQTSPNIDQLAGNGLVFREVFATAPYTLNSMSSLMTGFSWRDHNVYAGGDALSDSFLTLAELMQAHGYHTICYSGTPNFSVATSGDQGFSEFHEVWKHPDHGPHINPEFPERLLTARPVADFGAEPVFCYLHLIPPHEPYLPGPEHDLWHDPAYTGDIDGSYQTIMELARGERDWDEADLQQLIALYDGNLHRIDASVGRILEYWRGLQRSRELLVVILADHGEAFQEHGKFTHNSTVYDEMIRIPLIISPAHLAESLAPAVNSFLAITDIMPLLSKNLNVVLPSGSAWPRRFLRVMNDPTAYRTGILLQPAPKSVHVGYRTERYLAICDGWNRQELYDLQDDPAATTNLRLRYPEVYTTMIGQLQYCLEDTSNVAAAGESELSEQDIQTLRALGY